MKGKHIAAVRYSGRHLARKKGQPAAFRKETRTTIRLVICAAAFVALVVMKLLFPESVSAFAQSAVQLIGGDADFREAFAAVGRAVSGEETVGESLQEAYAAVFSPSYEISDGEPALNVNGEEILDAVSLEIPGEELIRCTAQLQSIPESSEDTMEAPEFLGETSGLTLDSVSYAGSISTLPDNASMEQRNLGFAYTTPVHGKLTSLFGWREHPVSGDTRFHYGIDLAADTGTEICAFANATVFATGESSTLGKYIILTHSGGYRTLYAHCSDILVKSGAVAMGEAIATIGETGTATGPHLHFELHSGSMYLNPIYYVELG